MGLLFHTLAFRWYVFLFLGTGLLFLSRAIGPSRAVIRFAYAYLVAYVCEYSSSRPGGWFPFGHYDYLPTTLGKEIWVGPLPLMDSLSFAFLMVASLGLVGWIEGRGILEMLSAPVRNVWVSLGLAVCYFVGIDVVIDPSSLRGSRWFLGQIYDYPGGGAYFGVTISNFVGWGVVGILILLGWRIRTASSAISAPDERPIIDRLGPVVLYLCVFLFNTGVAAWIGEWRLAFADLGVGAVMALAAITRRKALLSAPADNGFH